MQHVRFTARRRGPILSASGLLALVPVALLLLLSVPGVSAQEARGIDATFFAPGGSLDQQLPAELATAPVSQAASATATSGTSADQAVAAATASGSSADRKDPAVEAPAIPLGAGDLAYSGLRLVVGLGIVIALIFVINAFLKKTRLPFLVGSGLVRRLATETLGPNQAINIIEVSGKVIVVGVTDKGMTMLTELQGEEADRARLAYSRGTSESGGQAVRNTFGRALRQFTGPWLGGRLDPEAPLVPGMETSAEERLNARENAFENGRDTGRAAIRGAGRGMSRGGDLGPEREAGRSAERGSGLQADAAWSLPRRARGGSIQRNERGAAGFEEFESVGALPVSSGAEAFMPAVPEQKDRRRRLDERASAFLAQQQELVRGLNL